MPGQPLTPAEESQIRQWLAEGQSGDAIARRLGRAGSTIREFRARMQAESVPLPDPVPESGGPSLPEPVRESYEPFVIDTPGKWLVISDIHLPHHDKRTVELAVEEARKAGVVGVLLNGDVMDCGELSTHERNPTESRLEEELEIAQQFFAWLRSRLPRARIIWKAGNHEDRLPRFLCRNAAALVGNRHISLMKFVEGEKYGLEWVGDGRVVHLGKLHVVHGHEFKGGGGVNPARWLFLQATATALCGHFHRTSEHYETGLDRRVHGVWSLGCACFLWPAWYRNNKWNHGYAMVDLANDGHFCVTNRKILRDGKVV